MTNTLIWEAFATLDRPDLRELAKFVRSPFFNAKPQVTGLFDYLRQCVEQRQPPVEANAWLAAYPDTTLPLDLTKLRLVQSDLLACVEHYWIYREKFSDYERGKIRLAAVYRRKGLARHFNVTLKEAHKSRLNSPWRHAEHYHDLHLVEWEQFQFASAQKRYDTFNLQAIHDLMDTTYIARKLRHVCLARSHAALTGQQYEFALLDAILEEVTVSDRATLPAVGLYYHANYFLQPTHPQAEQHFELFRQLLTASAHEFPPDEVRTLYLLALNYTIKKSNTGGDTSAWFRYTLELYQAALALGVLLENGVLSRFAFNNIASVAIHLGEVDWAEQFVEQHVQDVERRFRSAARSLNLAKIAYARRDFDSALHLLQLADYRDLISGMSARIIQLKIYFETDAYELLESHLESIKIYLRRQRAAGYHRDSYLEIVRMTRRLMRLDYKNTAEVNALRTQISEHATLLEKAWFLAMVG
jgi:hypothetical protein